MNCYEICTENVCEDSVKSKLSNSLTGFYPFFVISEVKKQTATSSVK